MPLAFYAVALAVIKILTKVITGTVTAGLVYYFLSNVAKPQIDNLERQIIDKVSEFSVIGGSAMQLISYLDFVNCIHMLLAASAACFSLKMMSVAVRAFGINTGS